MNVGIRNYFFLPGEGRVWLMAARRRRSGGRCGRSSDFLSSSVSAVSTRRNRLADHRGSAVCFFFSVCVCQFVCCVKMFRFYANEAAPDRKTKGRPKRRVCARCTENRKAPNYLRGSRRIPMTLSETLWNSFFFSRSIKFFRGLLQFI